MQKYRSLPFPPVTSLAVMVAASMMSCGKDQVSTAPVEPLKSQTVQLKPFTSVEIDSAIESDINFGTKPSVTFEAPARLLSQLSAKVIGNHLQIEMTGSASTRSAIKAHIVTISLSAIHVNGASKATVFGLRSKAFELTAEGASNASISGDLGEIKVNAIGASTVDLSGKATKVSLDGSTASKVNLRHLEVASAVASASGASRVIFGPVPELDLVASDASTIEYEGNPKFLRKEATGASQIQPAQG